MKNPKNEKLAICDTCINYIVIAGCDCCAKCGAERLTDIDGIFSCTGYENKNEVNNEKKDSNA